MHYNCQKKLVLITGGTSGIGLACARTFVEDGAYVIVLGRSRDRWLQAQSLLIRAWQKNGTAPTGCDRVWSLPFAFVQADVSRVEECRRAAGQVAALIKQLQQQEGLAADGVYGPGGLDILVHSAGLYKEQRLENTSPADFTELLATNVQGIFFLTQALQPYFNRNGAMVTVASDAGLKGNYGCPAYCASKGAVVALTKALALDLAPHIRVNCVCPGDVATPLLTKQLQAAGGGYTLEDVAAAYPLERVATAAEVAQVICFAASPANSFMTGSILSVDGGLTAK